MEKLLQKIDLLKDKLRNHKRKIKNEYEDFKLNCRLTGGFYKESKTVKMFFNVISKWDRESLAKLLMFITGSSQVPIGGFRSFSEMECQ